MNGESRTREELLVTHVTLEVLGLLMLDEDFVVLEVPVAVPARRKMIKKKVFKHSNQSQTKFEISYQHQGFSTFFFLRPISCGGSGWVLPAIYSIKMSKKIDKLGKQRD